MIVHWLTRYGWEGASSRYRALQYLPDLEQVGITSTTEALAPWSASGARQASGVLARVRSVRALPPAADVLVVQKEPVMPPMAWTMVRRPLRHATKPVVWDVDDAVWLGRAGARRMATECARLASIVVAGNQLIADWAVDAGAADVRVIPTCYEPRGDGSRIGAADGDRINVVWIGSPATAPLLDQAAPLLLALGQRTRLKLTVVGAQPRPALAGVDAEYVAWSPENEHRALSSADYGLALQPRTDYADHKCGLKIVQYLSYGVVPVATDSPVHRDIVDDVGMLVDEREPLDELADALTVGPTEATRRRARQRWQTRYSRAQGAAAWHALLREVSR